mmetsp:Transcript_28276/g.68088  ORF Transcript_28276/g.68088 Transcript_28276/m.68088 type:complete len:512 (-) Transcript_28276:133-1668(-)
MKLSNPLVLLGSLLPASASAAKCGQWFSSNCMCDSDLRYCPDGTNEASDNIKDQHPFWKDYEGYYSYTFTSFMFGLYPTPDDWFLHGYSSPTVGFMNQTIVGSRAYSHRYLMDAPNPEANCSTPMPAYAPPGWDGTCGLNGMGLLQEGFGTSTPERDGTVTTTTALQPDAGSWDASGAGMSMDASAEYKSFPIDDKTLFGSAKSDAFLVTESFSFINEEKTEASAVQDVYMTAGNTTTLVSSSRVSFTRIESAAAFVDAVNAKYDEFNITYVKADLPMTKTCSRAAANGIAGECPREEDFCKVDPRCASTVKYQEPDASVKAGPIVGIVVACFVAFLAVLLAVLYHFHQKAMKDQASRIQAMFARRIAETIKLEGPDRTLTPEALAAEFKKIDGAGNTDGTIDKKELWDFLNSGKVAKMNESDFNALFSALDTDGDGTVSFMEFCAYMGKAYDEFEKMKKRKSVQEKRGGADIYYSGVSTRILSFAEEPKEEAEKMEKIAKSDSNAGEENA